jgi:transcriptional regulator with PAS, ATPase and Fis domain
MPLGSNSLKKVDVRIVAATNRNLEEQLRQKLMREDFFYRLNVVSIAAPPLRDRKEDIPLLIEHFLERYSKDGTRPTLPAHIAEALYQYDWPGNIRELQNALQRYLAVERLDFIGGRSPSPKGKDGNSLMEFERDGLTLGEAVEEFEKRFIARALEQNHWHRGRTAEMLGVPERTLRRKTKKYQI